MKFYSREMLQFFSIHHCSFNHLQYNNSTSGDQVLIVEEASIQMQILFFYLFETQ